MTALIECLTYVDDQFLIAPLILRMFYFCKFSLYDTIMHYYYTQPYSAATSSKLVVDNYFLKMLHRVVSVNGATLLIMEINNWYIASICLICMVCQS